MLLPLVDGLTAAATITLRLLTFLFLRHHPLGPRYLPRIYWSFAISIFGFAAQYLHATRTSDRPQRRRRAGVAPLLGWLDTTRPISSTLGVLLNLLSVLLCLDFVYRAHLLHQTPSLTFSRVGYVDATSARVVVRWPSAASSAMSLQAALGIEGGDGQVVAVETTTVSHEKDFVGTFTFSDLAPDAAYGYAIIATALQPQGGRSTPGELLQGAFRTTPSTDETRRFSLVSTSCIKSFYPYNPLDHPLSIRGLEHLDSYLGSVDSSPEMMLFLGDFIYIDLPQPISFSPETYTSLYRQVYASPSWTPRLRNLPWVHAYDDHEFKNDWAANETGLWKAAVHPFNHYQGLANPPSEENKTYFTFERGGVSFFVLDTRRYRSGMEVVDGPGKTMLGSEQLGELAGWLETEKRWKVVVSSVPFTRNWRGPDAADSWAGYLWERDVILEMMKRNGAPVILSGDRHEHATTLFPWDGDAAEGSDVIEFSTSPLNQFFEPFDRYHKEVEDTDRSVFNYYKGNSKFGVVTFDTTDAQSLEVKYDLVVDGKKIWSYDWTARNRTRE